MNFSATKKLIQVSEEIQKPVHVPIVLGNECFILTQQDVRKIEDVRFIFYHKIGPNGDLIPVETAYGQEVALRDAITIAGCFQANEQNTITKQQLLEILGKCCIQKEEQPPQPIKASIAQQMEWANSCTNSSSPPFPFTQSISTSMSDMPHERTSKFCCQKECCCSCAPKYFTHQGSNTLEDDATTDNNFEGSLSARQMLKIRKSIEDSIGI